MAFLNNWIAQVKKTFVKDVPPAPEPTKFHAATETDTTPVQPRVVATLVAAQAHQSHDQSSIPETPHLRAKQWLSGCVILDTETTGLNSDDEIVEISIIDHQGKVLLDTRVRPQKPIPSIATDIHGINNEMVASAPRWSEVHEAVFAALANRNVVIFNAEFDLRMLQQTASKYGLTAPPIMASCAMTAYAEYYGDWDEARQRWRFQSLALAANQQGIQMEEKLHSALVDCKTTQRVLQAMAANPVHHDRFEPELEADTHKQCGCDFGTFVHAYMEYAKFSGWSTSKSLAIAKCENWITQSIGPAGLALEWKETGVDPLASWKSDLELFSHRIQNMTPNEVAMALDAGEDINQVDSNGDTPLMMAALRNLDLAVLQLLIDRGSDINARNKYGETALHRAVVRGFETLKCVQLLVKAGAPIDITTIGNTTPLSEAIRVKCHDVVIFLRENGSKLQTKEDTATTLHYAARHSPGQIPDLLKRGANPNAFDDKGRTPLYWAMLGKNPANMRLSIRYLVEGGANLECNNSNMETPLIYALKNTSVPAEIVDCIVQLGANIKTKNRYGTTPLHLAAKHSLGPEKIQVLLRHGADSENITDRAGKTPKDYLTERASFPWPIRN